MELYDVIKKRKSVRKYKTDPIPEDVLNRILDAGRMAPSAKNIQPWHFVVIREPEMKKKVAEACRNQFFIADAGAIICGCAFEKVGIPDEYTIIGYPEDIMNHYKIDTDGIIEKVRAVMGKDFEEDEDWEDEV